MFVSISSVLLPQKFKLKTIIVFVIIHGNTNMFFFSSCLFFLVFLMQDQSLRLSYDP